MNEKLLRYRHLEAFTPLNLLITLACLLFLGGRASAEIWSPAPDGSGVFYNQGNVGIGTDTPDHQLSIKSFAGPPFWTSNYWGGALSLDNGRAIGWQTNNAGQRFGIGHTNGGFFMFRTASDPGTVLSPATYDFVLTDDGKVGIGTTKPSSKLEVQTDLRGFTQSDGTVMVGSYIGPTVLLRGRDGFPVRWGPTAGWLGTFSNHALHLFVKNGDPSLTVDTNGNVGIGTTAPVRKLHVGGSGFVEAAVQSSNERAMVSLNSTIRGSNRVWTLESGVFGTPGLFGIYDRTAGKARLTIDATGTVSVPVLKVTGGADVAEPFPMKEKVIEKGSVVVIDHEYPGQLKRSTRSYDKRVAGIVSGANGVNPGIALHGDGEMEGDQNVALNGRVYVKANTSSGRIEPGDLLTTSNVPGEAMKAADHVRAQGAILGKAMTPLDEQTGMVLVLVTLQ